MPNNYYTLGRSGLRVSRLALGAMTFGTDWGWGADEETSRKIFNQYIDAGGNFVDTANFYVNGKSEEMLGRFIKERKLRDQVVLATKFSFGTQPGNPNAGGNGRKNIYQAIDNSLQRLGTDYIDLYFLHAWDQLTPVEEVMRTLDDLVRAGKVRHVGLSDIPAWYASRAQTIAEFRGYEQVSTFQLQYSLVERNLEHEFVALGRETGAGIMVWGPLASGLLSGKYRIGAEGLQGTGRLQTMKDMTPASKQLGERQLRIIAELEQVANELGKPMAQVALNWVANRPGVASVIFGATNLSQLQSNIEALDFTIPTELTQRLNQVSAMEPPFPYNFFNQEMQLRLSNGTSVSDKPPGYYAL